LLRIWDLNQLSLHMPMTFLHRILLDELFHQREHTSSRWSECGAGEKAAATS
jgi:hypothetical protein